VLSGRRRRLAVLGHPVAHSRSPAMQSAALAELGLAGEWSYEAIDVEPEELEARVRAMAAEGFVGANVTVPHKLAALALADEASAAARAIGAANTLTFAPDGTIHADNTDAPGLLEALVPVCPPAGRSALVLGAGGSARAVVWALREAGAEVAVWNRTPERAHALAAELGVRAIGAPERAQIIVNCTSVGLSDPESTFKTLPLHADELDAGTCVVDMVYRDGGTKLLGEALSRGASVVDGLEILVAQGALSFERWTGTTAPRAAMREAASRSP
jgi:shikimate dehydrogenase